MIKTVLSRVVFIVSLLLVLVSVMAIIVSGVAGIYYLGLVLGLKHMAAIPAAVFGITTIPPLFYIGDFVLSKLCSSD